jgi:hypothetical protein
MTSPPPKPAVAVHSAVDYEPPQGNDDLTTDRTRTPTAQAEIQAQAEADAWATPRDAPRQADGDDFPTAVPATVTPAFPVVHPELSSAAAVIEEPE